MSHSQESVKELVLYLNGSSIWSIDFNDLFVSLSTFNFCPGFTFCHVEWEYMWYPLGAILLSNEYILLMCYCAI